MPDFPRFLLAALLWITPALAVSATGGEEDRPAIRDSIDQMWAALAEQDQERFENLSAEKWQLFTAAGSKFDADRLFEVHRENLTGFQLQGDNFDIHLRDDFAWCTYEATMAAERQGEPWGGTFLMTHLLEKREGKWISIHTHESKKPDTADNH